MGVRPLRREGDTPLEKRKLYANLVSIHAPPGGRDHCTGIRSIPAFVFQSTRPLGGATKTHRDIA